MLLRRSALLGDGTRRHAQAHAARRAADHDRRRWSQDPVDGARRADIVQVLGASFGTNGAVVDDLSSFRVEAFEQRLEWIAAAAKDRFSEIELSLMLVFVAITDDTEKTAKEFLDFLTATISRYGGQIGDVDVKLQTLLDSPVVAIGTLDEVCEKVTRVRDELGFSYFVMPYGSAPQSLEPIVARLADT
jgi:hypothetical protein